MMSWISLGSNIANAILVKSMNEASMCDEGIIQVTGTQDRNQGFCS